MRRTATKPRPARLTRPLTEPGALPLFQGPPVTTKARARRGDPSTSHRAAKGLGDLTERQLAALAVFAQYTGAGRGQIDDPSLVGLYETSHDPGPPSFPQSDSGLRTRRKELQDMGLVEACGETNTHTLFRITDKGRAVVKATR